MTTRSLLGIYNNVAVTAEYRCARTIDASDLKSALFNALAIVIPQHPILFAIPLDMDTTSPFFARLPSVDLKQVVEFVPLGQRGGSDGQVGAAYLDCLLQDRHNQPFRYTVPLSPFWKLYVLGNPVDPSRFTVSLFFHHCIADTKSALFLHEAIEAALNDACVTDPIETVNALDVPLLPPLDHFLANMPYVTRGPSHHDHIKKWTGASQFIPARTRFHSYRLSADTTRQFLKATKAKHVTLTAALQTMLVTALFQVLPEEYGSLRTDCAISLRPLLTTTIDADWIGSFVDNFSTDYSRVGFSWDEVFRTKCHMDRILQQKNWDNLCKKIAQIPDLRSWFQYQMGQSRETALELSNVGRLSSPRRERRYEIEDLLFSQAAGACSGAIKVSAVTGRNQRLSLGFSWQEGVVDDEIIGRLISELEHVVNHALCLYEASD